MNVPFAEIQVDSALVAELLAQQYPNLGMLPLCPIESGSDNVMFRLGESFAVRLPRSAAAAKLLENEQRWLIPLSDRLPLPVPVPVRLGRPGPGFPWPWSVVPWLLGNTADTAPLAAGEAPRLAEFLRALHVPAPPDAPHDAYRAVPLATRRASIDARIARLTRLTDLMTSRVRGAWEQAQESAVDVQSTWVHGDLHPRHVLTLEGTITGIIDWGDMGRGDPAVDLACFWMLLPDAPAREDAMSAYGSTSDALWARARGWAVLFGTLLVDTGLTTGNVRNTLMGAQTLRRI
jgi:aminoglycoside phosphotransferase (APT) family kinase protein